MTTVVCQNRERYSLRGRKHYVNSKFRILYSILFTLTHPFLFLSYFANSCRLMKQPELFIYVLSQ
jgi:hypothetical protein